jgi:D-3-phosphoglycerate dehydrogenase / 2-oxoglutarate reductase
MPPTFTAIVTSERYGSSNVSLEPERELARQFSDITIDLRGKPARTEDDLIAMGQEADALLLSTRDAVTRRVCEQIPRVKVIARYGVGLDNVDLPAATEHGIVITHYPQYCTDEVADHAVALLLTLNRRVVEQNQDVHDGVWGTYGPLTRSLLRGPIPVIRTLTIGVVGFGRIGRQVVARLTPFGARILVHDPYVHQEAIEATGAIASPLTELLASADLLTLHCPLTPETRGLLGPRQFASMKPDVAIVNTARGPIINETALVTFLSDNPAARAALDVFESEPLSASSPLFQLPNVILTPHSAYYSEQSVQTVRDQTFLSAVAVLRGEMPPTIANPEVLDRVPLRPPAD